MNRPEARYPDRLLRALQIALMVTTAICHAQTIRAHAPDPATKATSFPTESTPMASNRAASTEISHDGVHLLVSFDFAASGTLQVRYRLRNDRDSALAVFDRGDRHGVLSRRQTMGEVPQPAWAMDGDDAITLSHIALPLPQPAPTVPALPLAARLLPGAELEGEFSFDLPLNNAVSRLRWCLGVTEFQPSEFSSPEPSRNAEIWRASFAVVDRQTQLCTPWFDLASGQFAAH